jgi:alkanesulfonate monooxygenase SsuD/methylene tetrahydromethanopterin reductase-like flavin-dependent oxidoreductase (luciferase family)
MKFGLFTSAQANSGNLGPESGQGFRDYLDFNVAAERLGFVSSFSVEHHFSGWNQVSATLMLLTALAMRTTRLRLGSAVMVLPWHNPVLLAEQAATLDLISGGRLDLGIGKGYRHSEFKGFQIAPEEAEARFDEALEVMMRAWTERHRFSHRGRFWRFEDIVVEPPPAQQPHPPELIAERIALYKAERASHGLSFDPMQVAVARQLYVAKDEADREAALRRQAAYTRRTVEVSRTPTDASAGKPGSHVLAYADQPGGTEEHALFGTPDQIRAMLESLRQAGAHYVLLTFAGGMGQLARFAHEIMPSFSHHADAPQAAE